FMILRQWPAERGDVPLVVRTRRRKLGDAAGGANAGLRLECVRDGLVEARAGRGIVARVRQVQLERQHVGRLDAERYVAQPLDAGDEHAGTHEEHEGKRDLYDDEEIA